MSEGDSHRLSSVLHTSEASAKRAADADTFHRVFEQSGDGRLVLEYLTQRFARKLWIAGGQEGARETDRRIGQFEVVNFITHMINVAAGAEEPNP